MCVRYERCTFANRFLLREPILSPGLQMSGELRDHLFKGRSNSGLDLAAMLIQMGRDHGIPSYTTFRAQCGLGQPTSFDDLRDDV